MSAAAAAAPADAGGAKPKGKKKLIIIIVAVLVLLLGGGGMAMVLLKKKPAAGEEGEEAAQAEPEHKATKVDLKHPPTFVPLEPFVVNLADKETDRYAQVGITLQVDDAHLGEELKSFMPAIRNGILMILSHKSAKDLQERGGKEILAGQIQREAGRALGLDIEEPDDDEAADADPPKQPAADEGAPKKKKKKKKKKAADDNPVRGVLFSNFIIQ